MKKLFTNTVTVHSSREEIVTVLTNAARIAEWDPEISLVEQATQASGIASYHLTRLGSALNSEENLTISAPDSATVVYASKGGRLEYVLTFNLAEEEGYTRIQQTLEVEKDSDAHLPLTLLAPVAKHAFNVNLTNLGRVVEARLAVR